MRTGVCPGCGAACDLDGQSALRAVEIAWRAWETARSYGVPPPDDGLRGLAAAGHTNWFWACDACVNRGRAIAADVTKVTISMGSPFAAYVDRPFRCEDCGVDGVFSAAEQQHWFETLGFLIWVYPKQCPSCRAKRRSKKHAHKRLADALHNLDGSDPTQLDAVAKLYEEIGSNKAIEIRNRAKNLRRRT